MPQRKTQGAEQIMKAGGLRAAVAAAALAILMPAAAHASEIQGIRGAADGAGIQEKLDYCRNCHGDHFEGLTAYFTAPRLAGQQVEYLENQLNAFHGHVRNDPVAQRFMWPVITSVPKSMFPVIARRLSELHAAPAEDGPRHLVEAGRKIFEQGVPEDNVPACAACHGVEAQGQNQVPRLAGQLYPALLDELTDWQTGYRSKDPADPSNENVMVPIAKALTKEQTKAVAAYLSYQR
jgi:cytochrome c553